MLQFCNLHLISNVVKSEALPICCFDDGMQISKRPAQPRHNNLHSPSPDGRRFMIVFCAFISAFVTLSVCLCVTDHSTSGVLWRPLIGQEARSIPTPQGCGCLHGGIIETHDFQLRDSGLKMWKLGKILVKRSLKDFFQVFVPFGPLCNQ